jgi:hypothetical protein
MFLEFLKYLIKMFPTSFTTKKSFNYIKSHNRPEFLLQNSDNHFMMFEPFPSILNLISTKETFKVNEKSINIKKESSMIIMKEVLMIRSWKLLNCSIQYFAGARDSREKWKHIKLYRA